VLFRSARGTAKEFIDMNNPELELLPSRWAEGVLGISSESGYYLSSQLHDFYVRLKEPGGAPCTVLAGINPDTGKDKPSAAPTLPDRAPGYLPGDIAREGGNPAALAGTAIFKGDKMIGMLTNVETRMLAILMGNFPKGFLTLADPRVPEQNVYLLMRLGSAPKIEVSLIDDVPEINIEVLIECELSSISSGTNYEADELRPEIEQQVSKAISQEMKNMLVKTQELEADVVNFGKYLRPKVKNYDEFSAIDWNRLYPQAQIHIKVDAKLRRTGLMYKTMPIRE
jgi:spore germination protein KC